MIRRSLSQVADMIDAPDLSGPYEATVIRGVSTDTRTIEPGSLFVPIRGPRFNGHDFVADAIAQGATASLWCMDEPNPPAHLPLLYVDDTLKAVQRLAQAYRRQVRAKVIGITGSNGKTSTKDILSSLLAIRFKTQKTIGNLNNHLGVPLTLLRLEEDTEMAVVEMGMSGLGEIAMLSSIVQPDIAIITSVSEVHLGDLKTRGNIAQAKLEIVGGLKEDGLFIYNADNPILTERLERMELTCQKTSFGQSESFAFHPKSFFLDETGSYFSVDDPACPTLFLPLIGKHQMINALGAIGAARHFGLTYEDIRRGLRQVELTGMRNEVICIGSYTVINDAYKSNPTSVRAALETLYALPPYKRKIVVLGDMVELGDESEALHAQIGAELDPHRIDKLFTIGTMGVLIAESARRRFPTDQVIACTDKQELIVKLQEALTADSIVLIKGSRGLRLDEVVDVLRTEANTI
jgi:UDP-N-acetylmuramoyl-tripeptide--D-alanyl-D-alanine ligase